MCAGGEKRGRSGGEAIGEFQGENVTVRAVTATATAVIVVRWKPSACSRSLSPKIEDFRDAERATVSRTTRDIRALGTARADRARAGDSARFARREPTSPFQSARDLFVGSATERSPSRRPVQRNSPWRTERARAAGGRSPWSPARALFERVRCCAVDRARISRAATASGPRAFNAH